MFQAFAKFWQRVSSGPRDKQALAFLRIGAGLFYLYVGNQKLSNPHFDATLAHTLKDWAIHSPYPLYRQFLEHVALPHIHHLGLLVTDGELGIGLSYVLGLFVPLSAPFAVLMNANYLLASQQDGPSALGINIAFILIGLTLFWARAGKYYGLDGLTLPKAPTPEKSAFGKTSKKLKTTQDALAKQQSKSKSKHKSKPF